MRGRKQEQERGSKVQQPASGGAGPPPRRGRLGHRGRCGPRSFSSCFSPFLPSPSLFSLLSSLFSLPCCYFDFFFPSFSFIFLSFPFFLPFSRSAFSFVPSFSLLSSSSSLLPSRFLFSCGECVMTSLARGEYLLTSLVGDEYLMTSLVSDEYLVTSLARD